VALIAVVMFIVFYWSPKRTVSRSLLRTWTTIVENGDDDGTIARALAEAGYPLTH
jgi:hypothetical protein